jgi:hypothetical protein
MGCRRVPLQRTLMVAIALLAAAVLVASCGGTSSSGEQATSTPTPVSSASVITTPISAEDAAAIRALAVDYWAAFNAYNADKAISYLDETIGAAKVKSVRNEISQIKTFGVQLGVSEKSAPVLTAPGQAEMYLSMKTPTGTRTVLLKAAPRGDAWAITYVEEVK